MKFCASLTTLPSRIKNISETIKSLNNQTIKNFIKKRTKRVKVFCTGTINKYLSGSISQDLIYNAYCQKF